MVQDSKRLRAAREGLIERAGGALTVPEAAEVLGTTAGDIRARFREGALLAYPTAGGDHLLRIQFTSGDVIPGLEHVLAAMWVEDAWMRLQLFLDPDVLGALREGRIQDAAHAVRSYLPRDEG